MSTTSLYTSGLPAILAHRGGGDEAPENSREAIRGMLGHGVRVMETDVRPTRDGVAVLAHDPTLQRRFGDPRPISEVTWAELETMRDVDGAAALTLAGALEEFPQVAFNLDAKTDSIMREVLRAVRAAGAADRVCLTAFDCGRIDTMARVTRARTALGMGMRDVAALRVRSLAPRAARGAGAGARAGVAADDRARPAAVPPGRAVQVPLSFRGLPIVTPTFLRRAHAEGHVVHVWTVNEAAQMHRLLDMGVDGVVTDVPSVAAAVWRERGIPLG
ncbi:glycerophosphodiester phosphodiesterase family protein [Serinibacter salmoneus]|uniref:Glycerophosphoryl diester phosphodiesterase n=1 Tax=Serinibacter salmoneus TaxID=556530 RepID=A0A2A9D020_9MICO|nr:glycerophosphodiester phosphodiesterase family protein [Serinibacter salmoneus]PFG19983.1 glycerophosphoryl diester phosphodiesterase [Serinibacter salmoneus]